MRDFDLCSHGVWHGLKRNPHRAEKDTIPNGSSHWAMPRKKVSEMGPKIVPIAGYIRIQYVKCGRPNCHCASGLGHGPYAYRLTNLGGRKQKQYVRKADLMNVQAGIALFREQRAEIARMNDQATEHCRTLKQQLRFIKDQLRQTSFFS